LLIGLCFYFDLRGGCIYLNCELCGRKILECHKSEHHLNPVSQGGRNGKRIIVHELCHRQIHALFTDFELSLYYNTVEKLKEAEKIQKFLRWVETKDISFTIRIKESRERRRKRRLKNY
jgi:hypothetical protein